MYLYGRCQSHGAEVFHTQVLNECFFQTPLSNTLLKLKVLAFVNAFKCWWSCWVLIKHRCKCIHNGIISVVQKYGYVTAHIIPISLIFSGFFYILDHNKHISIKQFSSIGRSTLTGWFDIFAFVISLDCIILLMVLYFSAINCAALLAIVHFILT